MLWPHHLESFHFHSWRWIISFWFNEKKANFLCFTYILQSAGETSHSDSIYANDLHYEHRSIATFSFLCCKLFSFEKSISSSQCPIPHHWIVCSSCKALPKVEQLIGWNLIIFLFAFMVTSCSFWQELPYSFCLSFTVREFMCHYFSEIRSELENWFFAYFFFFFCLFWYSFLWCEARIWINFLRDYLLHQWHVK